MVAFRVFLAAALLSAAACAAENPVAGKWNCTNVPAAGTESPWTLLVREDGAKLAGSLTDGEVNVPLSEMKLEGGTFTFRFYINEKPYAFEGKVDGGKLEGKYSGEEASGKLRCERPAK
jgi:hypothetical protein